MFCFLRLWFSKPTRLRGTCFPYRLESRMRSPTDPFLPRPAALLTALRSPPTTTPSPTTLSPMGGTTRIRNWSSQMFLSRPCLLRLWLILKAGTDLWLTWKTWRLRLNLASSWFLLKLLLRRPHPRRRQLHRHPLWDRQPLVRPHLFPFLEFDRTLSSRLWPAPRRPRRTGVARALTSKGRLELWPW